MTHLTARWNLAGLCLAMGILIGSLPAAVAAQPKQAELPLKKIVLFSSGVGFFEHDGTVEGNAQAELQFNVDDINDLLMSLVVQDFDGGQVSTVSYGSKDPITKTLKTFAIDLTSNPTLAGLLAQVRGERVELEAPDKIAGVILGLERQKIPAGDDQVVEVDVLNLLTDDGLRAVPLNTVSRIRLVNEKLDAELRKALTLLASSHATDKKSVAVNFLGEGKRRVRVGYIQESPVWKTSYRLVLDAANAPLLQGWAIVENTTEEDWSGVNLTLVSGRPISFVMNLYEPLYIPRPVVQPQLFASLRPQVYGQDMADKKMLFARKAMSGPASTMAPPAAAKQPGMADALRREKSDRSRGIALGGGLLAEAEAKEESLAFGVAMEASVQSAAQAGEVGELFQYAIAMPVSLGRQKSAMLPIVNADIEGKKVSIYNPGVQPKHPLCGLKMTNTTELHLMQGPITVFDGGVYAGDARIEDMPPKSSRLISYAVDLDTEVAIEGKGRPEQLLSVQLIKGTMIVTQKYTRAKEYVVKNSGKEVKKVLVEQPFDAQWKLVTPKEPEEKTRDLYRFAIEAKPGEPSKLLVEEERTQSQHVALTNLNEAGIRIYLSAKVVDEKVKEALREIVRRKHEILQLAVRRQQFEQQIQEIVQEQSRIRDNMARLDRTSDLYKRYVKKFSEQEDTVERLRGQIHELTSQEASLQKALDEYMMGLDLK